MMGCEMVLLYGVGLLSVHRPKQVRIGTFEVI